MKFIIKCQTKLGSSFLLTAHGMAGARTTINNDYPPPSEKFLVPPIFNRRDKLRQKAGGQKEKGGLGKMNFCPSVVPQSGTAQKRY